MCSTFHLDDLKTVQGVHWFGFTWDQVYVVNHLNPCVLPYFGFDNI